MTAPWLVAMDWRDVLFLHWPVRYRTKRAGADAPLVHASTGVATRARSLVPV